jgi:hypothetical protein
MSIARHHAEWLSLLDISGPFLSMPVLLRAFPQGLNEPDPDLTRTLRLMVQVMRVHMSVNCNGIWRPSQTGG